MLRRLKKASQFFKAKDSRNQATSGNGFRQNDQRSINVDDGWERWTPEMLIDIKTVSAATVVEDEGRYIRRSDAAMPDDYAWTEYPSHRNCVICLEEHTDDDFPSHLITDSCTHIPNTCKECLRAHIKAEMQNKIWNDKVVKCPEPECGAPLEYSDIQIHADRETVSLFAQRMNDQLLNTMGTFFRCPGRGCGSGQEQVSGESQPIVRCIKCRQQFCFRHRVPWSQHATMSCAEYDAFLADPEHFRSQFELTNEAAEKELAAEKQRRRQQERDDWALAQSLEEEEEVVQREEAERRAEIERRRQEEEERREREEENRRREALQRDRELRALEARRRQAEESANIQTINRTTKPCPKCNWPIEKNEGW